MKTGRIINTLASVLRSTCDLVFPPCCPACHRSGYIICQQCLASMQPLQPPVCQHCNTPLLPNQACIHCQHHPLHITGLRVGSRYQGALRACIHALKYEGNTRLAVPLGDLLAHVYLHAGIQADLITAVPLHAERQRQRGYNQAQRLAEVCATRLSIPIDTALLTRIRPTQDQVHLTARERKLNVAGAFAYRPSLATGTLYKRTIVIIDDVCTTGATLEACGAPLFEAGAQAVWGLVLARP